MASHLSFFLSFFSVFPLCPTCQGSSTGKESTCSAGDPACIPGSERSTGEVIGYPLHYSGLESSMNCIVHGVAKNPDTTEWLSLSLYFCPISRLMCLCQSLVSNDQYKGIDFVFITLSPHSQLVPASSYFKGGCPQAKSWKSSVNCSPVERGERNQSNTPVCLAPESEAGPVKAVSIRCQNNFSVEPSQSKTVNSL